MKIDEKLNLLKKELDNRINSIKKKRERNKNMAFGLKILSVAFAAMITIFLGLKGMSQNETTLKDLALVLGASLTVINAYEAFFDHRALWIRETVTLSQLYNLKQDIDFYTIGAEPSEIEIERLEGFKERFSRILQNDLNEWLKLRSGNEKESDSKTSSKEV